MSALKSETKVLKKNNVQLKIIGDLSIFPNNIQQQAKHSINALSTCGGLILNIALNYGGRWDIAQAMQKISTKVATNKIAIKDINEQTIGQYLSLAGQPPVDLMIRTSGELRLSNFLLWDLAYSELTFTDTLWPDFTTKELKEIILQYQDRNRRFGQ